MEINTQILPATGIIHETVETPPADSQRVGPVHQGTPANLNAESQPHKELNPPASPSDKEVLSQLETLAQELNGNFEELKNTSIRFRVDRELGELLISVVDQRTDQVVRQIPSEEMVELTRRMQEFQGLIFDRTA